MINGYPSEINDNGAEIKIKSIIKTLLSLYNQLSDPEIRNLSLLANYKSKSLSIIIRRLIDATLVTHVRLGAIPILLRTRKKFRIPSTKNS